MKVYTFLATLLLTTHVFAQNLVPNWSFEDTVACPFGLTQIYLADGWSSWRNTPDYFHTCTNSNAGVPQNNMGFQFPRTGDAYAGFTTYAKFGTNGREILGIELIQSLIVGERYFLSFFVNNPLDPTTLQYGASNKTGARFSTVSYSQNVPIDNYAHVYTDSLITDSVGWVKISGSFIADSAYKFIGIGNFFTDSACTHILFDSVAAFVYYYIDDIKLSTDSNFVNGTENLYEADIFKIYPNPARDWIVIEGRNIRSIEVMDLCGRVILPKMTVSSFKTVVDISILSHGVYILKINTNTNSFNRRIIHY